MSRKRIDTRSTIKIDSSIHDEMVKIAKAKGNTVTSEYENIIKNHIKRYSEQQILKNSELEEMLDEKLNRIDKHLSSMLAKTGIDVDMILTGLIYKWLEENKSLNFDSMYTNLRESAVTMYKRKD